MANFITKVHIPRRAFLRGAGVTLAFPLLDSMIPAQTRAVTASAARIASRTLASTTGSMRRSVARPSPEQYHDSGGLCEHNQDLSNACRIHICAVSSYIF